MPVDENQNNTEQFVETNAEPGDEGATIKAEDINAWQYAWSRLIAKAWSDDQYQQELIQSEVNVAKALKDFGYTLPGHLKVKVELTAPGSSWDKNATRNVDGKEVKANGYIDILDQLSGTVIMKLPPKPENVNDQAFALADYGATGKDYPFSL